MSNKYLALNEAPHLSINYPDCDACLVEVESDGDGWMCPSCGTTWAYSADEDAVGNLYAEWSGEEPGGPAYTVDEAWLAPKVEHR